MNRNNFVYTHVNAGQRQPIECERHLAYDIYKALAQRYAHLSDLCFEVIIEGNNVEFITADKTVYTISVTKEADFE